MPPKDPEKFKDWLSYQNLSTQRKWSKPGYLDAHWKKVLESRNYLVGENHPRWKGDGVGYVYLHDYLREHILKPESCSHCGCGGRLELCNISGVYNRSIDNYIYLCPRCHKRMDNHAYKIMKIKTRYGLFFNQYYQEISALLLDVVR